jgi:hypothetical protein
LSDRGSFVHRRLGTVELRSVLMRFTIAVTSEHGGLFMYGRGASMRRPGIEVPCRGVAMRPFGPLQRFGGVQPGSLGGLGVGRGTGCQFGSALLQLADTFPRRLGARSGGLAGRRSRLSDAHEP